MAAFISLALRDTGGLTGVRRHWVGAEAKLPGDAKRALARHLATNCPLEAFHEGKIVLLIHFFPAWGCGEGCKSEKFKLQFKKKIPVPLVFSDLHKMKAKKCAQGLDLKKSRGSKSMNYIAAGLSETATDDQRWFSQLTSKNPGSAQGTEPPAQDYLNYLPGITSWHYFSTSAPSDSPKITVLEHPLPCSSLPVLQDTSWWDALGWEHYGICPGCCCPWSILLGCSTAYI